MNTTKVSLAEQLKGELMERYGLRADQVHLEVTFSTTDLDLGRKILKDFDKSTYPHEYFNYKYQNSDSVFGEDISFVSVHRKDGREGEYLHDNKF